MTMALILQEVQK